MYIQKLFFYLVVSNVFFLLTSCAQETREKKSLTDNNLEMDLSFNKDKSVAYVFTGTKADVEREKISFEEYQGKIDPANDIVLRASRYCKNGDYQHAEIEAKKAINEAKEKIPEMLAHNVLLDIYEATQKYPQAIEEINWLLEHVNQYAKPALIEKKKQFEKIIEEKKKGS